ncbi:XRE family transcriptional regulator [bacterium c-19]|nr:XRE family transcriptional regulator [bacterium c-19]
MDNTEIRTIIKNGLKQNHMTQAELASMLGIERATVNRWCVGRAIPEADTFLQVCIILNIHIDSYLYDGDDPLQLQIMAMMAQLDEKKKESVLRMLNQLMEMVNEIVPV